MPQKISRLAYILERGLKNTEINNQKIIEFVVQWYFKISRMTQKNLQHCDVLILSACV